MLTITPAGPADLDVILAMRDEASNWLKTKGIDQWTRAWPDDDTQATRILASINAGETWMIHDHDTPAATVAVDHYADPHLWTPGERAEPAAYMHRLIVARAYARIGLGAHIIEWIAVSAASQGLTWLRADVWTTNPGLQDYYTRHGWTHLRTVNVEAYPSGALFQRSTSKRSQ